MQPPAEQTRALDDDPVVMSEEMITKALEVTRTQIARCEHQRSELDRIIEDARQEEQLLARLLDLRRSAKAPSDDSRRQNQARELRPDLVKDSRHYVVGAVIKELEAVGRPLHISELMRLLRQKDITIPGAGTQANLITHLRRDARLVRPTRGMYGLAAWGLHNMPAGARRRRKKRVRTTRTSQGGNK